MIDFLRMSYRDALDANPGFGSGVYFIYDGDDLLYIGQSVNVQMRLLSHLYSRKTKFGRFIQSNKDAIDRLDVSFFETNAPEIYEAFWMIELKPLLNVAPPKLTYGPIVNPFPLGRRVVYIKKDTQP